jgi:ubiquinone/menaquinone biosynthesis C-methylase UbiE
LVVTGAPPASRAPETETTVETEATTEKEHAEDAAIVDERADRIRGELRSAIDVAPTESIKAVLQQPGKEDLYWGSLRCNACHHQGLTNEGHVASCINCGRRYPVEDHVLDMLEVSSNGQSIAQNIMEMESFVNAYESIYLPLFSRLTSGQGLEDTYALTVDHLELEGGLNVLDIGCGPGHFTRRFSDAIRGDVESLTVGVDISSTMLNQARSEQYRPEGDGLHYLRANPVRVPLADETMDRVHSAFALNFIPDPHTGLREMVRVARPGGIIVVTVLNRGVALSKKVPRPKGAMWFLALPALPLLATAATGAAIADLTKDAVFSTVGLRFFEVGEIAKVLEGYGAEALDTEEVGRLTIVKARKNEI